MLVGQQGTDGHCRGGDGEAQGLSNFGEKCSIAALAKTTPMPQVRATDTHQVVDGLEAIVLDAD